MTLLLNKKNQILLDELQNYFQIEFEQKKISYCEVFSIENKSTIYYNPLFVNDESIAHE